MMRHTLLILLVSLFFVQCDNDAKESSPEKEGSEVPASAAVPEADEKNDYAVCIWEKAIVRETPEEKGKYVASVNLAEKLNSSGEIMVDEKTSKKREYLKVKLMDGKEGWVIKDLILEKAKAGAVTSEIEMYARPDLLAKANKTFQKMDIVGVSETQGEWSKVKGKRTGGSWIEEGWIKSADLSYDEKDIAVAVYAKQAMALTPEEKKVAALTKITTNKDFDGSVFILDLKAQLDEIFAASLPKEEAVEEGMTEEGMTEEGMEE